ncbi:MAG TPA: ATPase domain-containing protein, partial [Thermoplasmata archaeon]|nr:ATPase domain-containing protein [Thermoplasmata archaeon]
MVATGVEGFDGLLPGGIPPTAAVVVQGPQGPEKYAFAHQFLAEGLAGGEGALAVITRTSPEDFFAELRALGVDVDAHLQAGSLVVVDWYTYKSRRVDAVEEGRSIVRSSASLVNLEIAFVDGMKKLHGFPAKRCVVDLLSPAIKLFGPTLTYDLTGSLRTRLKGAG